MRLIMTQLDTCHARSMAVSLSSQTGIFHYSDDCHRETEWPVLVLDNNQNKEVL
jgi:hypothetical protein